MLCVGERRRCRDGHGHLLWRHLCWCGRRLQQRRSSVSTDRGCAPILRVELFLPRGELEEARAALLQQLIVLSLDDGTVLEYRDLVSAADC